MPGWFILSIIVAVAGGIVLLVRHFLTTTVTNENDYDRDPSKPVQVKTVRPAYLGWTAVGLGLLAALLVLVSCYNPVGTKEEGIVTSFGKTTGHLSNGPHLTWPWEKVHQMDAAIQTDSYVGNNCITVRIANQVVACAPLSFQWRIRPEMAEELYKDFRSFDHVRDALVTRNLVQAANRALATYNPLDHVAGGTGKVPANGVDNGTLQTLSKDITRIMREQIGNLADAEQDRVIVLSTILQPLKFDDATQGRINQLQQQVALTRIAIQRKETNLAEAKANAALAASVNNSPNVLVARCLDTFEAMVKGNQSVPDGFSCWPGGNLAGILAPAAGK